MESPQRRLTPRTVAAFAVHVFTACGAACALLALMAAVGARWPQMFLWLGIALIIDGVDGTFARRLRVAELLPRWSGEVLDLVVDVVTYVFVPAYAIAASGLLPPSVATAARRCRCRDRRALFRRPANEDDRPLFPRLSGAVERGGVLFVPAEAASLAWRAAGRGAGGTDFRAVSFHSPGPHCALARAHDGRAHRVGAARGPLQC